ncbi:MAG: polysaccharide biosynthesis tyrosine autokinase, partial [Alloprevotella sp.]|nr:polysaccharide biosynthesis tyrosine autokinase [Alloprevotella sp.]
MEQQNNTNNNQVNRQRQEEEAQLIPLLKTCFRIFIAKWYLFALSCIICLALGWLYQQRKQRIYQRQAVMLIEDSGGGTGAGKSALRGRGNLGNLLELNGVSVGDNLKNEMFILGSERLMRRVVDTLGLDVEMQTMQSLHLVPLYKQEPFRLTFAQKAAAPAQFCVSILSDGSLRLYDFRGADPETGEPFEESSSSDIKARLGQSVKTPAGELRFEKLPAFDKFPRNKEILVRHLPIELAAKMYKASLTAAEFDKESSLIVLSSRDASPERASDVLYEVYNAYKLDVVDNKNRVANSTAHFIESRLAIIGQELSEVESKLASFKQQNNIADFQTSAATLTTENAEARKRALEAQTRLSVAEYLREFLEDHSNRTEVIPSLNLEGAGFNTQIANYNQMMNERNRIVANSSEQNPLVQETDVRLAQLRSSILHSIRSYEQSKRLEAQDAMSVEGNLSSKLAQAPIQEKLGLDIQRQQTLKEALYTYLLNKREEVALQLAINEANVRLVEEPLGSSAPIAPRRMVILAASFLIGLLIPALFIWIKTLFDVTITSRRDVEEQTSIPVLGDVPHWKEVAELGNISKAKSDDPIVEAFRMLRYNINFMQRNAKVLLLTSSTPGHGKSFISRNLAAVMGMTKKRVLLIDADIRKRTLSKELAKGKDQRGLTDWLIDEDKLMRLDELVLVNQLSDNVDFLPAGKLPPNPAELLMGSRLDELVEAAKEVYDYIIFDATPMLAVADAGIVDRVADLTLFVMRVGRQDKAFLPEIEQLYQNGKFNHLSIVINDADIKAGSYGYGYGYGGYGY